MDASTQIETIVREMTAAWLEGRFDDLGRVFHDNVVAVAPPESGSRIVGRERMVDSFRQFTAQAKVHEFHTLAVDVEVFETTAIAMLRFQIKYEMSGQVYEDRGADLLVFARENEIWQVVWRTQIPSAPSNPS
jgi:hypothetical protein